MTARRDITGTQGVRAGTGGEAIADYRPPYLAAAIAAIAVWLLYALTLAPTTAFWDTSEYIATAHIMGIPHPPGNPLFVVLARAWELLLAPTGLSVAVRINLFSATMSALAHGFWFLLVHRILASFSEARLFRLAGAAAAVAISATAFTVWNQSNVNEKVYTVSLLTIAILSWLAFRWRDSRSLAEAQGAARPQGKDDNLILLMVFILALSVGNHLMAFLAAPALVVMMLLVEPRTFVNWRLYAAAAVVAVIGLSIHLFLPLRAALDPVINEADPSTWQALLESLGRKQYSKPSMLTDPTDPRLETPRSIGLLIAQIGNYIQYFDWQWARSIQGGDELFAGGRGIFTLLFAGLGLYGAAEHYRRDRVSFAYMAVLVATLSFALIFYLNFKYGYSYGEIVGVGREAREVRERDYFFIVSFSLWGLWAGVGLAALWLRLSERARQWRADATERGRLALASPVLLIALLPLVLNFSWARRNYDYAARDWAYNLLMSVEPYSVLFTNGDNDTFPLWYLQEVEGIRRDVTVIVMSYLNTPWYVKQLKQLTTPCVEGRSAEDDDTRIICQRRFDAEMGPAFYAARMVRTEDADAPTRLLPADTLPRPGRTVPTRSIIPLDDDQIDDIVNTPPTLTQQSQVFRAGDIETVVPPNTVIIPADWFMAAIITSSIDDRPIYFAATTQAYRRFNLSPYLIRRGVALKLSPVPPEQAADEGVIPMPEPYRPVLGSYVDLPMSDSLLWNVYMHRGGLPEEWEFWVDRSTQGIPFYYWHAHLGAAQAHSALGDSTAAARHIERMDAWLELGER